MQKNQATKTIRLLIGAAEAESSNANIADEFIPQITKARADLALMRGTDVLAAVIELRRSGLHAMDVRKRNRVMSKEVSERRPVRG